MCSVLPRALIQANRHERNAKFEENSLLQPLHSGKPPFGQNGNEAPGENVKVPTPHGYEQGGWAEILRVNIAKMKMWEN